jgi:uncharacterized membrane protein
MNTADLSQTNVIAVDFTDDDKAYAALAALKKLDSEAVIDLHEAAVVTRDANGRVFTKDTAGAQEPVGIATGGIVGLLIGVLGGPLGVLLGGTTGILIGALYDMDDAEDTDSVLTAFSGTVRAGHNTVLAELREPSDHAAVDKVLVAKSGTVLRRNKRDVEVELAAAEEAQRKARKEAQKRLREERLHEHKAEVDAKIADLKGKLTPHRDAASEKESKAGVHAGASA